MIRAGVASFPARKKSLALMVESLLPQVDQLVVHLNGYGRAPYFLKHPRIEVVNGPDVGDAGKFSRVADWDGYYLSCDDDLLYPSDYVERLCGAIEARHRRAVCGFHGGVYVPPYTDSIADRMTYRCLDEVTDDHIVHLLGTGALGFHTDTISITPELFVCPNMADIWFAVHAQGVGVQLVCLKHQGGWLQDINPGGPQIFESTRDRDGSSCDTRDRQEAEIRRIPWRIVLDMGAKTSECGVDCSEYLDFWREFWGKHANPAAPPVAMMDCLGYYEGLRPKSRSMVRQANRNYSYSAFVFNDHLQEIEAINLSKPVTSEGPMRGWYTRPVTARDEFQLCASHRDTWFGGFSKKDGTLRGFCRLAKLNEFAVIRDIFAGAGATGVLNGLLAHMAEAADVRYLTYHTMEGGSPSRQKFKERTGFRDYRIVVKG